MKKYVWCEDSGSGFLFWEHIFHSLYPEMIVESKNNNSGLRKAVEKISDTENDYYLIIDSAIDNLDVLRELQRLKQTIKDKDNIRLISIPSFEFVILSFTMLEKWVFAEYDELKKKRADLLDFKNSIISIFYNGGNKEDLSKLKEKPGTMEGSNNEQLLSNLLFHITRNTGFETDKGKLGICFTVDCCDWNDRQSDDICGLDESRIKSQDKAKIMFENSILKSAFSEVGL